MLYAALSVCYKTMCTETAHHPSPKHSFLIQGYQTQHYRYLGLDIS